MVLRLTEDEYAAYLRKGQPAPVSEAAFMQAVVKLARQYGWMYYHTWSSKKSPEGFPDLVLAHPHPARNTPQGKIVFAELKTETGQVTKAQQAWINTLQAIDSVECYVWRPSDLEEIVRALRYNL